MPEQIRDGSGKCYLAKINSNNQLVTRSTTVDQRTHSALDYNYFETSTGAITLTDANEKGIIKITNNETLDLIVDRIFFSVWPSTGGDSNGGILRYYRNPTTTGGSAITPLNSNFGNESALDVTALKSLTTMTGTEYAHDYLTVGSYVFTEGQIILPTGYSFGLSIQAPTGNTSMKVTVSFSAYLFDKELL